MKEKKILNALNEIDNEFIEEAMPIEQVAKNKTYYKWLAVAASVILAVGISVTAYHFHVVNSNKNIYESNKTSEITTRGEVTTEKKNPDSVTETKTEPATEFVTETVIVGADTWENYSIEEKYPNVDYNSSNYFIVKKIDKSAVGKKIRDTVATGYDPFSNEKHTTDATLYEIKNTSSYCAIAVKFKGDENYFSYTNRNCKFETLGELIEKFNFEENININSGYYKENDIAVIEYSNPKKSDITDFLYKHKSLKPIEEPTDIVLLDDLTFNIEIESITDELGYYIGIARSGYLCINIFHTQHLYYIGKENAEAFINSFTENNIGRKLVTTTEKADANDIATDDDIIVTEAFSNAYMP
ncbi:MAG: hypothetical protein E7536_02050 [Ruminococcaceae bacterium]|nr:hypothetical protein [Oscillospiraceae bacterium]